jgi:hypothetical protein
VAAGLAALVLAACGPIGGGERIWSRAVAPMVVLTPDSVAAEGILALELGADDAYPGGQVRFVFETVGTEENPPPYLFTVIDERRLEADGTNAWVDPEFVAVIDGYGAGAPYVMSVPPCSGHCPRWRYNFAALGASLDEVLEIIWSASLTQVGAEAPVVPSPALAITPAVPAPADAVFGVVSEETVPLGGFGAPAVQTVAIEYPTDTWATVQVLTASRTPGMTPLVGLEGTEPQPRGVATVDLDRGLCGDGRCIQTVEVHTDMGRAGAFLLVVRISPPAVGDSVGVWLAGP